MIDSRKIMSVRNSKDISRLAVMFGSALVLASCGGSPDQPQTTTSVTTTTTNSAPPSAQPLVSPLKQTYILDDNIQYAIDSYVKAKNLGKSTKGKTAVDGSLFYIVRFRAKNNGQQSATVTIDNFEIKSADGQNYHPSDDGKLVITNNGGSRELFGAELQPGVAKPFLAVFEIPVESMKSGADLIIPSTKSSSADRWVLRCSAFK